MKLNIQAVNHERTHENGQAAPINVMQALRRSVMSCLLWESEFYEDGQEIYKRIIGLAEHVGHAELAALAVETKNNKMRHVPLLLAAILCKLAKGPLVSATVENVIRRADELAEFVAIIAKVNGVSPNAVKTKLSAQAKKGLAKAFLKFNTYQLAKYNRDGVVKLRDVAFLCHPKPNEAIQALIDNKLEIPDTWEVQLSSGADKKETFERLIKDGKLGYMALLRNLRNMVEANVDPNMVRAALLDGQGADFPFRFVSAAKAAPQFEPELDTAMLKSIEGMPVLVGKTAILIDVSGSMDEKLSSRSDMTRMDAAASLGSIVKSDNLRVFTFSNQLVEVPPRRGMAGAEAIVRSQFHQSTHLEQAIQSLNSLYAYDRLIVITDEQSHDGIHMPPEGSKAYLINVASNKNGVGYGRWVHIDGFSENVIRFIYEMEQAK